MKKSLKFKEYIGSPLPGENVDLAFVLENYGSTSAADFIIEFLPYENLIEVNRCKKI